MTLVLSMPWTDQSSLQGFNEPAFQRHKATQSSPAQSAPSVLQVFFYLHNHPLAHLSRFCRHLGRYWHYLSPSWRYLSAV